MKWKNRVAVRQYYLKRDIEHYSQEVDDIRHKEVVTGCSDSFNEQAAIFGLNMSIDEYQSLEKPIYIGDTTFIKTNKDKIGNELAQLLSEKNNKNYVYREIANKTTKQKTFELVNMEDNNDVIILPDLENIEFNLQNCINYRRDELEINIVNYDNVAYAYPRYPIVGSVYHHDDYLNYSIINAFLIALNIKRFLLGRDLSDEEVAKIRAKHIEAYKENEYFCTARFYDSFFDLEEKKVYQKNIEN